MRSVDELQRWLDMAPTLRRAQVFWVGSDGETPWEVELTEKDSPRVGAGHGGSLTFAVVAAILHFQSQEA